MMKNIFRLDFFGALILVIGLFIGASVSYAAAVGLSPLFAEDMLENPWFSLFSYILSLVVPIVFFYVFILKTQAVRLRFDFSTKPLRVYFLIFSMMSGMMLIADYAAELIPKTGRLLGPLYKLYSQQFEKIAVEPVSLILMTVVFAPLLEEILFRGIVLKGLLNNNVKPLFAIFISAFVFGLVHFNPWQFVGALLLGVVLGLVYYRTKSLLMSVLLHAFNNLTGALMLLFSDHETFSGLFGMSQEIVLLLGVIVFSVAFYFFVVQKNIIYID